MKRILLVCVIAVFLLTGCNMGVPNGGQSDNATPTADASKEVTKISLNKQKADMDVGGTIQITATVTPSDAENANLTWSSSDESVALVNSDGYVTGVGAGYANIVCRSSNGIEASCTVTVKEDKAAASSKTGDDGNDHGSNNTTIIYYGHYHPDYVFDASDFVFPESSYRKLTRSEVAAKLSSMSGSTVSGSFAQDAINEIYARNGYIFNTPSIRAYYESKPWYYKDPSFTTSDFSDVERYNIDLLTDFS